MTKIYSCPPRWVPLFFHSNRVLAEHRASSPPFENPRGTKHSHVTSSPHQEYVGSDVYHFHTRPENTVHVLYGVLTLSREQGHGRAYTLALTM